MTTLSERRANHHLNQSQGRFNDEVEPKLDSIISNTNYNSLSGTMASTIAAGGVSTSSIIDIGINSGIYKFHWTGTESNQNVKYVIHISNDNITFHPYHSAVALKINGYISIEYKCVFKYHKLTVTNTHASQATTIDLIFSGRH